MVIEPAPSIGVARKNVRTDLRHRVLRNTGAEMASDIVFVPLWCQTGAPAPEVRELRCHVAPPSGWQPTPALTPMDSVVEGVWRGPDERDTLTVSFMPKAVPGHRMLTWIEAPLALGGFPEPAMRPRPALMHWEEQPPPPALFAQLGVDELHTLRGLAKGDRGVARLYAVLARRQQHAWKLFLSLASAAGRGAELT